MCAGLALDAPTGAAMSIPTLGSGLSVPTGTADLPGGITPVIDLLPKPGSNADPAVLQQPAAVTAGASTQARPKAVPPGVGSGRTAPRPASTAGSASAALAGTKPAGSPIKVKVWDEFVSSDAGYSDSLRAKVDVPVGKGRTFSATAFQRIRVPNTRGKLPNATTGVGIGLEQVVFKNKGTEFSVNAGVYGQVTIPVGHGSNATEFGVTAGLSLKQSLTKDLRLDVTAKETYSFTSSAGRTTEANKFNGEANLRYTLPGTNGVSITGGMAIEDNMPEGRRNDHLALAATAAINVPIGKHGWYVEGAAAYGILGNGSTNPGYPFPENDGGFSIRLSVGNGFSVNR
jgi:hypothetical protein